MKHRLCPESPLCVPACPWDPRWAHDVSVPRSPPLWNGRSTRCGGAGPARSGRGAVSPGVVGRARPRAGAAVSLRRPVRGTEAGALSSAALCAPRPGPGLPLLSGCSLGGVSVSPWGARDANQLRPLWRGGFAGVWGPARPSLCSQEPPSSAVPPPCGARTATGGRLGVPTPGHMPPSPKPAPPGAPDREVDPKGRWGRPREWEGQGPRAASEI